MATEPSFGTLEFDESSAPALKAETPFRLAVMGDFSGRTAKSVELRSLNPAQAERTLSVTDVLWIARIMWASQ